MTSSPIHVYYSRSILVCVLLGLTACAGPNAMARTIAPIGFGSLDHGDRHAHLQRLQRLPFIVHFRAGDTIPVDFVLDSSLLGLPPQSLSLVAKRDFYVLFREDGPPLLSEDGVDFERRSKNHFAFGFVLQGEEPARVKIGIGLRPAP